LQIAILSHFAMIFNFTKPDHAPYAKRALDGAQHLAEFYYVVIGKRIKAGYDINVYSCV